MKWWKYCWAVIGNIIFIFILMGIFSNIADGNTRKLLAASILVYLCAIAVGVQLTRQIGAGFAATMTVLQSMVKRSAPSGDIDEDQDFKIELDAAVSRIDKDIKERDVKIIINACFALINSIWMLTILLSSS